MSSPSPTCWYSIRDDAGRHECGAPATHRNFTGAKWFYLCEAHAIQVQKSTKGKMRPSPLVATLLAEKLHTLPLSSVGSVPSVAQSPAPHSHAEVRPSGLTPSQSEQLRRFRENLAARGDSGSL